MLQHKPNDPPLRTCPKTKRSASVTNERRRHRPWLQPKCDIVRNLCLGGGTSSAMPKCAVGYPSLQCRMRQRAIEVLALRAPALDNREAWMDCAGHQTRQGNRRQLFLRRSHRIGMLRGEHLGAPLPSHPEAVVLKQAVGPGMPNDENDVRSVQAG